MGLSGSIAFMHTLAGPDHYLPFIVLARARKWSIWKAIFVTLICGIGHVFSSVLIGSLGALAGIGIQQMEIFKNFQGNLVGWLFMVFGAIYFAWSLIQLKKGKSHKHFESSDLNEIYVFEHNHKTNPIVRPDQKFKVTPWVLFVIFVLGPCEPLLPLLTYPAVQNSWTGYFSILLIFTLVTIATMLLVVVFGIFGLQLVHIQFLDRNANWLAAMVIFLSGFAIVGLGL